MDEIEAALRRLFETGVLDDERFARRYAEDKRDLSGWGPERIREALAGPRRPDRHDRRRRSRRTPTAISSTAPARSSIRRARPLDDDADRRRALGSWRAAATSYEIAYEAVRRASSRAA